MIINLLIDDFVLHFSVIMKKKSGTESETKLMGALKQIQFRAQVKFGHTLTHDDLAELAGVNKRSLGDWMRGVCAPAGMSAVFELLSQLHEHDVLEILEEWRSGSSSNAPERKDSNLKTGRPSLSRKQPGAAATKKKTPR